MMAGAATLQWTAAVPAKVPSAARLSLIQGCIGIFFEGMVILIRSLYGTKPLKREVIQLFPEKYLFKKTAVNVGVAQTWDRG